MTDFDAEFKKVWATLDKIVATQEKAAADAEAQRRKDAESRRKAAAEAETQRKAEAEAEAKAEAERRKAEMQRRKEEAEYKAQLRKAEAEWKKEEAEAKAQLRKEYAEYEAERKKSGAEFDRRLKAVSEQIGGFTNNYGESLEEEFFRAVEDEMRIGDISLHELRRNSRNRYEYDIVGINGDCVAVGEIKHKLLPQDVVKFAEERLPHYAEDFPGVAKNRKVLGMIGGGLISKDAQKEAKERGLMILRLKNKKLVVDNAKGARPVSPAL